MKNSSRGIIAGIAVLFIMFSFSSDNTSQQKQNSKKSNVDFNNVMKYINQTKNNENTNTTSANIDTPLSRKISTPSQQKVTETIPISQEYVLNTNTHKFHKSTCSSISQMKESNTEYFSGSRDEIISRGYSPCQRCNP